MTRTMKDLVADANTRVETISPDEADTMAAGGGLILDVREPGELETVGSIAGALNVPRGILETRADSSLDTAEAGLVDRRGSAPILVLCAAGGRAALAADTLRDMGYDAKVIQGGIAGWKSAGLPVEK